MQVAVRLEGFTEQRKALKQLHPEYVPTLRNDLKKVIDKTVVPRARAKALGDRPATKRPRRATGRAAASIRSGATASAVYVAGGNARAPYFGWRDFGGELKPKGRRHNQQSRPFLQRGRYLYPSVDASTDEIVRGALDAFTTAARKVGLDAR